MKRKILTLSTLSALSTIALVAIATGQDEPQNSPPPGDNPPSSLSAPSSLRDNSPTPTPAAEESATPASTPRAQTPPKASASPAASRAEKSSTSSSERKRERTERDEEETSPGSSRASAAVTAGPDRGSPESNVKRLENQWEASVKAHDVSFLQARVAEDFIGVSSRGKRLNKSSLMKEFKTDSDTYSSAKNSAIVVRAIDKDVAVASGVAKEVGRTRDGAKFSRSYIWTDTWAMRGDHWQCVASHVMLEGGR